MHDATLTRFPQPPASALRRRRRLAATSVALSLCLVLAACGGDDKKGDETAPEAGPPVTEFTGDPNRACALATEAEVEAAIATKVKPGVGALGAVCTYTTETAADQYVVLDRTESPEAPQIFELDKSSSTGVEPLAGVGNAAFVAGNKAYVLEGTVLVVITVNLKQPQPAVTAITKKLAQAAAPRL